MTNIILYRGDFEKIREFDFHKTNKNCYVGQGIYLTNSLEVAMTYRSKGERYIPGIIRKEPVLFQGQAKDRLHALQEAFKVFFMERLREEFGFYSLPKEGTKPYSQFREKVKLEFDLLVEQKDIVAEYSFNPYNSSIRNITVTRSYCGSTIGYITEFSFDKTTLEASVIPTFGRIYDTTFWEIVYNNKIEMGIFKDNLKDFVATNLYNFNPWKPRETSLSIPHKKTSVVRILRGNKNKRTTYSELRRVLMPYGYRGFEYEGGVNTNGKRHRAFCLWDDEFVNQHKVRRFR